MYRRIEDFLRNWEYEAANTSKMIGALTEAARGQAVAPGHRTLDRLAWHLAQSIPEMMNQTGLSVTGVDPHAPVPGNIAAIKKAYDDASASLAEAVKTNWNDDTLEIEDNMYGEKWQRGSDSYRSHNASGAPSRPDDGADAAGRPESPRRLWSGDGRLGCVRPAGTAGLSARIRCVNSEISYLGGIVMERKEFLKSMTAFLGGLAFTGDLTWAGLRGQIQKAAAGEEEQFWKLVRDQFVLDPEWTYLNFGGLGSCPLPVINSLKEWTRSEERAPSAGHDGEGFGGPSRKNSPAFWERPAAKRIWL